MCAVSREHPLATKKYLEISDLYGETLMMVKEGDSETNDLIRNDLRKITQTFELKILRNSMTCLYLTVV